jgi:hypothetical protein
VTAGWNWSADDVRRVGYRAVDFIADYLSDLPHRPVFQPYPGERANALAAEPVPVSGAPVDAVLDHFVEQVAPYPFGNGHPRFFAWVNPPPHPLGIFAEALAAAMNPERGRRQPRDAFLAGTRVDGVTALRACVVNPGSSAADADAVLGVVRAALSRLDRDSVPTADDRVP